MIWSLGGNYFHALSSSDLFKRRTTITLQSSAFFFSLLSQEKKGRNKNEAKWCFCSLTSLSKTISVAGGEFCNFTVAHKSSPVFNTLGITTSAQTPLYKNIHIRWFYRHLHCMCNILYRETKHHFYAWITIANNVKSQPVQLLSETRRTDLLWLQLKARRCASINEH